MNRIHGIRLPVVLALTMLLMFGTVSGLMATTRVGDARNHAATTESLHDTLRTLWDDHVFWTRMYIVESVADLPTKDATAQRLLQNQADMGKAFAAYYGEDTGAQLTKLLQDHILGAVAVLDAAKAGDQAALETANAAWYANGDDIAVFLNSLNPDNWPLDTLKSAMKMHLDQTLAEATAQLTGDYPASIADFDEARAHMIMVADILSQGIEAQFPNGPA